MAAIFFDGFDYYTPGNTSALPITSRWNVSNAGATVITVATGRYPNSQALSMVGNSTSFSYAQAMISQTPLTTITVGFSARFTAYQSTSDTFLELLNANTNAVQVRLSLFTGGVIRIHPGGGAVAASSSAGAIPLNTWVYVEFEMVLNSAGSGRFTVYVNGASVATVSASTAAYVGADFIKWYCNSAQTYLVDDMYVSDTATKLGESRVVVMSPSADTAQKNFQTVPPTGLAGNYDAVNGLTVDNTDWIYGGTQGWKDIYEVDDMPFNPAQIHGIQPIYVARKDDTADMSVRVNLISGANTINGTTNNLLNSTTNWYLYQDPIIINNPATGLPWKASDINNLKMGPEIL